MRETTRRMPLAFLCLAPALAAAGTCSPAHADAIVATENFRTSATIGTEGVSGPSAVSFQGVENGTLTTGTPFSLGQLVATGAPGGGSTTYRSTPIEITFTTTGVNGATPTPNTTPVVLMGLLNGVVTGNDLSKLAMNFEWVLIEPGVPFEVPIFPAASLANGALPIVTEAQRSFRAGSLVNTLLATSFHSGDAPIVAELDVTQVVPEPAPLALFAALAGFALFRRNNRPKAR